jgi:hypothetical protein
MLSLRWFRSTEGDPWNMFEQDEPVRFAWLTMPLAGGPIHCAVGPEQWVKGGHHATWMPDGERISMNLKIDGDAMRFVQVARDGSGLGKMLDETLGSGHPTVHRDGRHLITDSYAQEPVAFGDGSVPLRWIDLSDGGERTIARVPVESGVADSALRIDPHPAWDRTWLWVTFNGFVEGTRRVFIADMQPLLE